MATTDIAQTERKVTKGDLTKCFWHSLSVDGSFNYERQMSLAFQYSISPVLKRLYPKKEDMAEALVRHSEFYNVTPPLSPLVTGIAAAMEEQHANDPEFDVTTINAVKASLMGPLSGIGDSLFWGTYRPLLGGIAASLALTGNAFAPILFVVAYNVVNLACRYYGVHWGYKMGTSFLTKIQKSGLMDKVFYCAAVVGLLAVGAMVASMVSVSLGISFGEGDGVIVLNDVLNGILPQMLPLAVTGLLYWAIRKGWKVNTLLLVIIAVGIFGAWTGLLA